MSMNIMAVGLMEASCSPTMVGSALFNDHVGTGRVQMNVEGAIHCKCIHMNTKYIFNTGSCWLPGRFGTVSNENLSLLLMNKIVLLYQIRNACTHIVTLMRPSGRMTQYSNS